MASTEKIAVRQSRFRQLEKLSQRRRKLENKVRQRLPAGNNSDSDILPQKTHRSRKAMTVCPEAHEELEV